MKKQMVKFYALAMVAMMAASPVSCVQAAGGMDVAEAVREAVPGQ